ncbi:MAG: ABC transporter permease subunit [Planctomycetes bacterium]|nr:ABC transporter permease subunit [Planctomycetota bacterium]
MKAGGASIIAAIFGILIFILIEVLPLARSARVEEALRVPYRGEPARGLLSDEYLTHAVTLGLDGRLQVIRLGEEAPQVVEERDLLRGAPSASVPEGESSAPAGEPKTAGPGPEPVLTRVQAHPSFRLLSASRSDGRVLLAPVRWKISFSEAEGRIVSCELPDLITLQVDPRGRPLSAYALVKEEGESDALPVTIVAQLEDGRLALVERKVKVNLFTDEVEETVDSSYVEIDWKLKDVVLDPSGKNLYAVTLDDRLIRWPRQRGGLGEPQVIESSGSSITAMTLLTGGRSLALGHGDGRVSIWFQVRDASDRFQLRRIREFTGAASPVSSLTTCPRNRSFFALHEDSSLELFFSTSERLLWQGKSPVKGTTAVCYGTKGDAVLFAGQDSLVVKRVENPHPEISLKALFGEVWYEDYEEPEYAWQSTGLNDSFESKMSLVPLLFGTLKGAFYSLLLAIPLGVLAALYTSQLMSPRLQKYVKPTVEIMAALPTVILGFLAGLWLAPRVERFLPGLLMMSVVLPLFVVAAGWLWGRMPLRIRNSIPDGSMAFYFCAVLALGIWFSVAFSGVLESWVFGGNIRNWLFEVTGLRYDQRNALVVGIVMGFAVIPIVFTISEESFSSVPRSLVAGSLALGATRWQTVASIVLPSGSPGMFAATMVGFGRAVGETMIVLMATGNTPVLNWNPFDGFRTLSANIAVEIPEAPHGATLYRTLFLSALMLFLVTFLVNTAAEVVRLRLRKRFGQL